MTNLENMNNFIEFLKEDEDVKNMKEDYELSDDDNSKLIKGIADKAIEFDANGKLLSLEEWKEIYINAAIIITSSSYDVATGKKRPRVKNYVSKSINWTIEKLDKDYKDVEDIEDSYDDGNRFTK